MKDKIMSFKIESEAKDAFDTICKELHTTPSQQLRLFVHKAIKGTPRVQ